MVPDYIFVKADESEKTGLYRIGENGTLLQYVSKESDGQESRAKTECEFVPTTEKPESASDISLRIAHPYDLFKSGKWSALQQTFLKEGNETGKKQPFKQVFRELYVKLPEEQEINMSRMFAGNQIQPQKTVGALRNRRWMNYAF